MKCTFLDAVRVRLERTSDKSVFRAPAADITVAVPLSCPVCHKVTDYQVVTYGSLYAAGDNGPDVYRYHLPNFAELWANVVERIGVVYCRYCGTGGILIQDHRQSVLSHLRVNYHAQVMIAALDSLGFGVSATDGTYQIGGGATYGQLVVVPRG